MSQSYLKCSIDGVNGSGKSGTSARLAVGISKELCNSAPVLAFDSEERWRFYKPTIFDVERVPLIIVPGTSLKALQKALATAEAEGCCCFIGDQLTTPWMEGVKAFSYEDGNLSFDRRQQLMNEWDQVVRRFRYGQFHAICCGRLGYHWENIEDEETGRTKLVQGDSKFNAGGGSNFGYEADLELELRRRKRRTIPSIKQILSRRGLAVEHVCDVVKDAAAGLLNGQQFVFPTSEGGYKAGDYKPVLKAFRPYLDFMASVPPPQPNAQTSRDLLVSGKTPWAKDQTERKNLLEELEANLNFCFPGGEKKSKEHAMYRNLTLEALNGYISWSRMEDEAETSQIERNVLIVRAMRKRIESGELPTNQASLIGLVHLSIEDVMKPNNGKTLLEVMTMPKKQPIVEALDVYDREDSIAGD